MELIVHEVGRAFGRLYRGLLWLYVAVWLLLLGLCAAGSVAAVRDGRDPLPVLGLAVIVTAGGSLWLAAMPWLRARTPR